MNDTKSLFFHGICNKSGHGEIDIFHGRMNSVSFRHATVGRLSARRQWHGESANKNEFKDEQMSKVEQTTKHVNGKTGKTAGDTLI